MARKKPKILFIEDDGNQVLLYKTKFELEGFEFLSAPDGCAGLKAAKDARPDLIFLDIVMPGENGMETLKKLKRDEATAKIPTALFTNLSDKALRERGLKMGATEYFVKTDISLSGLIAWAREHARRPRTAEGHA